MDGYVMTNQPTPPLSAIDDAMKAYGQGTGTLHECHLLINRYTEACAAQVSADKDKRIEVLEAANVWQPIETAPEDGRVLLWANDKPYAAVKVTDPATGDKQWSLGSMPGLTKALLVGEATHWMPLPQPPDQKALAATETDDD